MSKVGNSQIIGIAKGSTRITAAYKGSSLFFRLSKYGAVINGNTLVILADNLAEIDGTEDALSITQNDTTKASLDVLSKIFKTKKKRNGSI